MGLSTQRKGRYTVLAVCAAAVLTPTTAAAYDGSQVPVDVPLHGLGTVLAEVPRIGASVPTALTALPGEPHVLKDDEVRVPLVPELLTETETPSLVAELPLSGPTGRTVTGAMVPGSPLWALTPAADLTLPLTNPGASEDGLPRLTLPDLSTTTPALQSAAAATLGSGD